MGTSFKQSFFIPEPALTEKNCPALDGKTYIVTGGYAGIGFELCKILYAHNANVFIAGRSASKADSALAALRSASPEAKGRVEFIKLDLADRNTIKSGIQPFLEKEKDLHGLMLNAGVMFPSKGSVDAHGTELQIGTNCVGHYLLYQLLKPLLASTAARSPPATVRVGWAGSLGVDVMSPRNGGMTLEDNGRPVVHSMVQPDYGQSKVGNVFFAHIEAERETRASGVVHLAFNPGNLKTELQRHTPYSKYLFMWMLHPAINGAYTELFVLLSPDVTVEKSGGYVWPFGRFGGYRADIQQALKSKEDGGTGLAAKFMGWCEKEIQPYI